METQESSSAASERRQNPRTKLVEIAYIGMGPENGGLVLDVSDGGLSFHSVAPVQPTEKIQFLLSLRGHSRIEGTGEVVWTNEMKTICGLRFISLSSGAREHINSWTNQSRIPQPAHPRRFEASLAPAEAAQTLPQPAQTEAVRATDTGPIATAVFAIRPAFESPITAPDANSPGLWREPIFLCAVGVVLASAIGFSAYKYGVRQGRLESVAAPRSAQASPPQPTQEGSAPSAVPTPASVASTPTDEEAVAAAVPASGVAKPTPAGTFVNTSKTEATAAASQTLPTEEKTSAPTDRNEQQLQAGQSELAAAQAYLSGANGNRDSAKAVRLLWAAVGNGNSTAEVLLADLYVRGDGVEKNCEQGRILLVAAIKSGNIEAQQKLRDLNLRGCKQ